MKIRLHPDWPEDKRIFIDQWDFTKDRPDWSFRIEFGTKPFWYGFEIQVGAGDSEDEIGLFLGFPFITLYLSYQHRWLTKFLKKFPNIGDGYSLPMDNKDHYGSHGHEISAQWTPRDSRLSLVLWQYVIDGSNKRSWHFTYDDFFLGKSNYKKEILQTGVTEIAMPEGEYSATYEVATQSWWRQRFPFLKKKHTSIYFDIPAGIPHEGKGENSWDCGMDATYGIGTEWHGNLHDAINKVALRCLEERAQYGSLCSPDYLKWKKESEARIAKKKSK